MVRRRNPNSLDDDSVRTPDPSAEVDSLRRGLEVLRLFDARHRSLHITEIAAKLGLSRITVTKLVSTLEAHKFLRPAVQDGHYEPHVACLSIGRSVKRGLAVVQAAQPRMLELSEHFGVHVTLSTRDRIHMLVVEHVVPAGLVRLGLDTGARLPMASSASGRAYLWAQPAPVRKKLLAFIKDEEGRGAPYLLSHVQEAFQELEQRGWCSLSAPVSSQSSSIATPIGAIGQSEFVMAAMAVGSEGKRMLRVQVAPELLVQAGQIAQDLGMVA